MTIPRRRHRRIMAVAFVGLAMAVSAAACSSRAHSFEAQLEAIVDPYQFSIVAWSAGALLRGDEPLEESLRWGPGDPEAARVVLDYFALSSQARSVQAAVDRAPAGEPSSVTSARIQEMDDLLYRKEALSDTVELLIGRQVGATLKDLEIYHPLDRALPIRAAFPPLSFELEELPHLLIISPRERIERIAEVMLIQDLDAEAIDAIEGRCDALGVSSLVLDLGGFGGTFPTFVADDASLEWTIPTVVEEWLHQYLAFTPLGFQLVLGYLRLLENPDAAALNETVAGIVSEEVGQAVLERYYPAYARRLQAGVTEAPPPDPGAFDFNQEMREIRLTVDALLAAGQAEQAERLMEERRQALLAQGYFIRKLNQAYFAFYGTYAAEPTSVDPLGEQVRELRKRSPSLPAFLRMASHWTSREDVTEALATPAMAVQSPFAAAG
jgi:hypothetical protein